ncbi:hypothetical protein SLS57_000253 [Botryosphaeria dothidea]
MAVIRKRTKRLTAYVFMIWAELIASFIISFISWFYMMGSVPPSFEFFFFVLVFWVIQIQVILQIIVNRVGLLVTDKDRVRNMKWFVGIYVGIINVSVFCIWMPAQLQRSATWVKINHVWDRVTKGLFLLLDGALNFYFLYMVRRDLIANGLYKYTALFWTNVSMAIVSVFMDIAIILSMSFNNPFVYVQFHPLAYILKLTIEMSLADLIAKVVSASNSIQEHPSTGLDGSYFDDILDRAGNNNDDDNHTDTETAPATTGTVARYQPKTKDSKNEARTLGDLETTTSTSTSTENTIEDGVARLDLHGGDEDDDDDDDDDDDAAGASSKEENMIPTTLTDVMGDQVLRAEHVEEKSG